MNIFIVGGGRVGFHLARLLSVDQHDITVIECDPVCVEQIDYALDVSTVTGNGASILLQQELGVPEADLFVSMSGDDEINLIAAATAKGLGAKRTVARVEDPIYLESNILYETIFGIDFILSPHALTALDIIKCVESPGMVAIEDFGRGRIQMQHMRVMRSPTRRGKTLKDVKWPEGVLLGIISRNGDVIIPRGDTVIEVGDFVTLIGKKDRMESVHRLFQGKQEKTQSVAIMGGGRIGFHLAQMLENRQIAVKLFERSLHRCNDLATQLKRTEIVCRDATTRVSLEQEQVDHIDVFVATTDDDERNIMASVLAKEVGVSRTVAVVHQPDFASLVTKLDVDHAVTPRACVASRVMKLAQTKDVSSLAVLEEGRVEILEFAVKEDSPIIGKSFREIRFPRNSLAATILRDDEVIVPTGDDTVLAGDSIVMVTAADSSEALQKLFHR